jgi:PIN domain nuclease of toxin-antitoxin system
LTTSSPNVEPKRRRNEAMPFILDASARLAVVLKEPGADVVLDALNTGSRMSAVNAAEVASRLHQEGWTTFQVNAVFQELPVHILPFDLDAPILTARYRPATRPWGLSLGNRACLATGYLQFGTVLTAGRAWTRLDLHDVDIHCMR